MAAQATIEGSTPDVVFFDLAVAANANGEQEEAEKYWRLCLAAGDLKAHYGLGYTLMDLGREREAYGHLVTYTVLAPQLAWAWSWRARAALAIGEQREARICAERALALHGGDEDASDAAELLAELDD